MNLVAKEFVASRKDRKGILIISEMAGAAKELSSALVINPNDVHEVAEKIRQGFEMSEEEQGIRMAAMQQRIAGYDVQAWAEDFIKGLNNIKIRQQTFQEQFLDEFSRRRILDRFRASHKRLLLLDYDGTLVPFTGIPEMAKPEASLLKLLSNLGKRANTEVYLISGRSSEWLQKHFAALPIHLVAEHGAMFKNKNEAWRSEAPIGAEWKDRIQHIMEPFVRRCPNSFIEEKKFSLVWHYRNADVAQGKWHAHALVCELHEYLGASHLQVVMADKIVEVKTRGIDKGTSVKKILSTGPFDFVFAVGDDKTDEDMFKALAGQANCFTIKVGPKASYAQYNLMRPQMVTALLQNMAHLPVQNLVP
jgi:trehalose 6-phosphate synthase/phosphatase